MDLQWQFWHSPLWSLTENHESLLDHLPQLKLFWAWSFPALSLKKVRDCLQLPSTTPPKLCPLAVLNPALWGGKRPQNHAAPGSLNHSSLPNICHQALNCLLSHFLTVTFCLLHPAEAKAPYCLCCCLFRQCHYTTAGASASLASCTWPTSKMQQATKSMKFQQAFISSAAFSLTSVHQHLAPNCHDQTRSGSLPLLSPF